MKPEHFEQRLFRILARARYPPISILTISPEELVEVPSITVPNIRTILCIQNKILIDQKAIRLGVVKAILEGLGDGSAN